MPNEIIILISKHYINRINKNVNSLCSLNKAADRAAIPSAFSLVKGDGNMVTYSDLFTFVIMICAIITLIRNDKDKK